MSMTDLERVLRGVIGHQIAPLAHEVFSAAKSEGARNASISRTYTHGGMIPPGGITHGSDAS